MMTSTQMLIVTARNDVSTLYSMEGKGYLGHQSKSLEQATGNMQHDTMVSSYEECRLIILFY